MTSTPGKPMLHAIGNAHIDPVWLWRWPEGLETVRATFRSALDRIKEYPDFIFTGSSAAFYAWLKEVDPDMFAEVRACVRAGRWEIVGGWWIQPDANIPGESRWFAMRCMDSVSSNTNLVWLLESATTRIRLDIQEPCHRFCAAPA